jgi:hypothetical protein
MNVRVINLLKNKSWLFWILVITFSISLFIILGCNIFPFFRDDTIYFNAARQFSEHLTTYGNTIINFDYSKIGEFNWYGPGYHLVYGSISYIFGFHSGKTSLVFHLIIWFMVIRLIRKQFPDNANDISLILIASPFLYFIFTFYPIVLNSTVTIIGFLFLLKSVNSRAQLISTNVLFFLATLTFGTFLRITHIFNFALLYSFVKSKKNFFTITGFFLALVGLTWFYQIWFCAPMYIAADDVVNKLIVNSPLTLFFTVLKSFSVNLIKNMLSLDPLGLQIWLSILTLFTSPLFITKTRFAEIKHIYFGVLLFNAALLFVLLGLYSPRPFYVNKQLVVLFPVNVIFIIVYIAKSKIFKYSFMFMNLLFFPFNVAETYKNLQLSQSTYSFIQSDSLMQNLNDFIALNASTKKAETINILVDHKSFDDIPETEYCGFICSLPYENQTGQHLRYVFVIPTASSPNLLENPKSNYYISLQEKSNTEKLKLVDKKDRLYLYEVLH